MGTIPDFLGCVTSALTVYMFNEFKRFTKIISKVENAKTVPALSGLRSLLHQPNSKDLFLVRGTVSVQPNWSSFLGGDHFRALHSFSSPSSQGHVDCVVIKATMALGVPQLSPFFEWKINVDKSIPFALLSPNRSSYVLVNSFEHKIHHVPLSTIYCHPPDNPTPYFSCTWPYGILEEKILPLGKELTAIGTLSLDDAGFPQIDPSPHLPLFLSTMTKDEILLALADTRAWFMWATIFLGSLSLVIFSLSLGKWMWKRTRPRL